LRGRPESEGHAVAQRPALRGLAGVPRAPGAANRERGEAVLCRAGRPRRRRVRRDERVAARAAGSCSRRQFAACRLGRVGGCPNKAIAGALAAVANVKYLVLAAIERDTNNVKEYDIDAAMRLVTLKLVGYTEVIHVLLPHFDQRAAVLIFGGSLAVAHSASFGLSVIVGTWAVSLLQHDGYGRRLAGALLR
jgi:hypothetical protein